MLDGQTLLAKSRNITSDAGKVLATLLRAETARHLALHAPGAHIAFSLIVVKGNTLVVQEAQHRLTVMLTAHRQIPSRRLLRPTWSSRNRRRFRIGLQPGVEQGIEPTLKGHRELGCQRAALVLVIHPAQRIPTLNSTQYKRGLPIR